MPLPDLVSLALFVRAVDAKSLSKAAEQPHIALAAASRRIALRARQMMDQARKLEGDLSDYAKGVKGHIRIKANTPAITQFCRRISPIFLRAAATLSAKPSAPVTCERYVTAVVR